MELMLRYLGEKKMATAFITEACSIREDCLESAQKDQALVGQL
ncbi:hypothetical protein [Alistipes finegoldii]|nr:hypothetical protein [Alistipes finegoldii]